MIESPGVAELAVSFYRFPPRGVCGSADIVVHASAYGIDDGYLARVDEELLVMCQVETAAGLAEIEAIAGVEGVDVVQMEPLDLSVSMGHLWMVGDGQSIDILEDRNARVFEDRRAPLRSVVERALLQAVEFIEVVESNLSVMARDIWDSFSLS
ncbi:2-keto-3-deoxy-L-rhamnonate aldolase-like [Phoenix dactylifera]|uniref:2-keto-3-deoxy-L-rhamnonate aldolase-like n=1 Tax=Phoenix dactylifera TaxID=42345 RepID=A0A8B9AUK2_PHODC|nr:2-keto-3-deoxy-L-rhamnonate aldolase-like [Phoenix dactylifera]